MAGRFLTALHVALLLIGPAMAENGTAAHVLSTTPYMVWQDKAKPDLKCEIYAGKSGRIEDRCKQIYLQCGPGWERKICGGLTPPIF